MAEGYLESRTRVGHVRLPRAARPADAAPAHRRHAARSAPPSGCRRWCRGWRPVVPRRAAPAGRDRTSRAGARRDALSVRGLEPSGAPPPARRAAAALPTRPNGAGHERLREAIAAYLGRSRAVRCRADQVRGRAAARSRRSTCARGCWSIPATTWRWRIPATRARAAVRGRGRRSSIRCRSTPRALVVGGIAGAGARLAYVTPSHQFPIGRVAVAGAAAGAARLGARAPAPHPRGRLRQRVPLQRRAAAVAAGARSTRRPRDLRRHVLAR